jgi:RHS repeat-associated protein
MVWKCFHRWCIDNQVGGTKNAYGCSSRQFYDSLNRLTKSVDAMDGETAYTYDYAGNRLTVTDAEGKLTRNGFDDLGRLSSEADHANRSVFYKTDEAGNVVERTSRLNVVRRMNFDIANRLVRSFDASGFAVETFEYDAPGNLYKTNYATYTYDALNRVLVKLGSTSTQSFTYTKAGNVLSKTGSSGVTEHVHNAANRLVQLRNAGFVQVDYAYDPAGNLLGRTMSSGASTQYEYDKNGWISRLRHFDAVNALISDTSYLRDRMGNILNQTVSVGSSANASAMLTAGTTTYTYDALFRLRTADYPGTANDEVFTFDKVGNRKTHTLGSLSANASTKFYNYDSGTNRLANIRIGSMSGAIESTFSHDLEGRLTNQTGVGAKTLNWDSRNRVSSIAMPNTPTATMSYDAADQRTGKSGGAQGGYLTMSLEGSHVEAVYGGGGTLSEKYLRGSTTDELVAGFILEGTNKPIPKLYHQDHIGSISAITDRKGGVMQSFTYSAFGQVQRAAGGGIARLKYTGRDDDETGLYYYRARYYDPRIGRFISEDPMGYAAGINFYAYANNNPVNANDPSGLEPYTSRYPSWDAAALGAAGTMSQVPMTRNVEFAGLVYQNRIRIPELPTYSYTTLVSQNSRNSVSINFDTVLSQRMIEPGVLPRVIHNHPLGVELSFSRQDAVDLQETAERASARGFQPPYGGYLYSVQANDVKAQTLNAIGGPITTTTVGQVMQPIKLNMFEGGADPAAGGFLLYPNKANNNQMRAVYAK